MQAGSIEFRHQNISAVLRKGRVVLHCAGE